jgi:hypothetical protein
MVFRKQIIHRNIQRPGQNRLAVGVMPLAGPYGLLSPQYQAFAFGQSGRNRDGTAVREVPENGVRDPQVALANGFGFWVHALTNGLIESEHFADHLEQQGYIQLLLLPFC